MSSEITEAACQSVAHHVKCCPTNPNSKICKYPNPNICKNPNPDICKYPNIQKENIFIWRAVLSPEITDSASQLVPMLCHHINSQIFPLHLKGKSDKDVKWFHEYY